MDAQRAAFLLDGPSLGGSRLCGSWQFERTSGDRGELSLAAHVPPKRCLRVLPIARGRFQQFPFRSAVLRETRGLPPGSMIWSDTDRGALQTPLTIQHLCDQILLSGARFLTPQTKRVLAQDDVQHIAGPWRPPRSSVAKADIDALNPASFSAQMCTGRPVSVPVRLSGWRAVRRNRSLVAIRVVPLQHGEMFLAVTLYITKDPNLRLVRMIERLAEAPHAPKSPRLRALRLTYAHLFMDDVWWKEQLHGAVNMRRRIPDELAFAHPELVITRSGTPRQQIMPKDPSPAML